MFSNTRGRTCAIKNGEKDYRFLRKGPVQTVVVFIIIFLDLMDIRINSECAPRVKVHVLICADFMYNRIVIIENTQAQYCDNLISKLCGSVLNNDNTVKHQFSH